MNKKEALFGKFQGLTGVIKRYRYVLLVIAAGVVLLALPSGGGTAQSSPAVPAGEEERFSVEELEHKLERTLSQIDGAGDVQVVLTVRSGMLRVLAQDGTLEQDSQGVQRQTETVVISSGSGTQEAVLVQQIYPQFQGALVVCPGGDSPAVRLRLTEAVAALTGLGADKISVCKGK